MIANEITFISDRSGAKKLQAMFDHVYTALRSDYSDAYFWGESRYVGYIEKLKDVLNGMEDIRNSFEWYREDAESCGEDDVEYSLTSYYPLLAAAAIGYAMAKPPKGVKSREAVIALAGLMDAANVTFNNEFELQTKENDGGETLC